MIKVNKVYHIDALELLKLLPDNSVDCCVTSPPYFGLRDYGVAGQTGLEPTPQAYVQTLVTLFRELRRVLKDSGTFWLNLGDSYNGSGKGPGDSERLQTTNAGSIIDRRTDIEGLAPKQLMLIPHRVAIADPVQPHSIKRRGRAVSDTHKNFAGAPGQTPHSMFRARPNKQDGAGNRQYTGFNERYDGQATPLANKRSVWIIPPAQFREAHFATFPLELPEICIRAGCPPGGLVLDPFMGSGTTALVARAEGRDFIGSELNAEYVEIANKRLAQPYNLPMFTGML